MTYTKEHVDLINAIREESIDDQLGKVIEDGVKKHGIDFMVAAATRFLDFGVALGKAAKMFDTAPYVEALKEKPQVAIDLESDDLGDGVIREQLTVRAASLVYRDKDGDTNA